MKFSAVIPARNEAADLPRLLASLKFADEVLVIDTGSTDATANIAAQHDARVIRHDFVNYAQIRNYGDQMAKNDWILSLDADNVVPAELATEVTALPDTPATYRLGRLNYIWGQPLLYADWSPKDDCHIRLYHRTGGHWQNGVHELYSTNLPTKTLKNPLLHYNYATINEFIDKLNAYSNLAPVFPWWQGIYDFLKRFFYKLGFFAGLRGFFLCYLQALYYMVVAIKHRQP